MPKRRRLTGPELIASMMIEDCGSNFGQDPTAGPERMPINQAAGLHVIDAVGTERHTEMRECSAQSCANNVKGRHCGLAAISINDHGGCDNYEADEEEECDDEVPDEDAETIIGISKLIPNEFDVPTGRGAISGMYGHFNSGFPF